MGDVEKKKKSKILIFGGTGYYVSCNYEKDIAEYTVKVATDPRTENGLIIYRLPKCIITQMDLISIWEKKIGRTMEKTFISGEKLIHLSEKINQDLSLRCTPSLVP
ncbi:hypothetical protein AG4045_030249 [Apium graveolens]|uniref:NmrA-like domain-containing protein n=1 Tax=Apium graveolens TaxID=4045 RepID=A0A6L5BA61_APIGR|nr:hypothetical protein AG4045_030249 [Apium graveolens]